MMKLRIPPIVLLACSGMLSWWLAERLPSFDFTWWFGKGFGLALIGAGGIMLAISVAAFIRAKTTVNPTDPAQTKDLVTSGLYQISRNPMYLGMAAVLLGIALLLANFAAFSGPVFFVWIVTLLQIKPEETALQKVFGEDYQSYRLRVRRWI